MRLSVKNVAAERDNGFVRTLGARSRSRYALALLTPKPFTSAELVRFETWRMRVGPFGAQAIREFPTERYEFPPAAFAADRRIAAMRWERAEG